MSSRIPAAVLAATGSVGQRFIQLLDGHPWFEVAAVTGSERSAGSLYGESCHWVLPEPMPEWAKHLRVTATEELEMDVPLIFSALPAKVARSAEPEFARRGAIVCSNASAFRMDPYVPILLPEVNPDHLAVIGKQRQVHGWKGAIVTNSNCTSTGMTVVLKALQDQFGVRKVLAVSMQALSGAGYPGVASLDILDNVIPYIAGEEEKVETESCKMLGHVAGGQVQPAEIQVSAHTNRVAVSDGHIVCLSVELERQASVEEAGQALQAYQAPEPSRDLPSAPCPVIALRSEPDRPQPRLDRMTGRGMTTTVGRLRPDPLFHLKMVVLSHNTVRGAAGGSIYNAELLYNHGLLS